MNWRAERSALIWVVLIFTGCYLLPIGWPRFDNALQAALLQTRGYARDHVLLGMVPAFFIAGAIKVFVRREMVLRYLGASAKRSVALAVAAVSGAILTVCSCTVLPLFESIYRAGAGLGPACAFLYSGPAINVTATIITARVLGFELAAVRGIGAVLFSVLVGVAMWSLFRTPIGESATDGSEFESCGAEADGTRGAPWVGNLMMVLMIAILVAANWSSGEGEHCDAEGVRHLRLELNWVVSALLSLWLGGIMVRKLAMPLWKVAAVAAGVVAVWLWSCMPVMGFTAGMVGLWLGCATEKGALNSWAVESWESAKRTLPLLFLGIVISGFLLGGHGNEGLIPSEWVTAAVGGNSLRATFISSACSALMYFSSCTEVPVIQGLMEAGMGRGSVLALMLAGPAMSLPGLMLITRVLGAKRTITFAVLVIGMATLTGWVYGLISA